MILLQYLTRSNPATQPARPVSGHSALLLKKKKKKKKKRTGAVVETAEVNVLMHEMTQCGVVTELCLVQAVEVHGLGPCGHMRQWASREDAVLCRRTRCSRRGQRCCCLPQCQSINFHKVGKAHGCEEVRRDGPNKTQVPPLGHP